MRSAGSDIAARSGSGVLTAALSVFGMLSVVSYVDGTPIVPASFREWRETVEYGLSIALSFLTGNILVILVLWLLPNTIASGGKPSAAAYRMARMLGQHVGEETHAQARAPHPGPDANRRSACAA